VVLAALLTFGGCLSLIGGGGEDKQKQSAASRAKKEKAAPEKQAQRSEKTVEKTHKPAPPPEPHEPEERIVWRLKKTNHDVTLVDHIDPVVVRTLPSGCKMATINYETMFVGSNLDLDPPTYYRAVYKDPELHSQMCFVRTNAYGEKTDDYGKKHHVRLLTTSMSRRTAEKINWKNQGSVNFARLFRTEYLAPSAKADIARENAREAADCVEDQGLFDFDELQC
jgi:hypothetical protein